MRERGWRRTVSISLPAWTWIERERRNGRDLGEVERLLRICATAAAVHRIRRSDPPSTHRLLIHPVLAPVFEWLERGARGEVRILIGRLIADVAANRGGRLMVTRLTSMAARQESIGESAAERLVVESGIEATGGVVMLADIPISDAARRSILLMTDPHERYVTTVLLSRICLAMAAVGSVLAGADLEITDPFVSNLAGYISDVLGDETSAEPITVTYGGIEITFEMRGDSEFPLNVISVNRDGAA